MAGVWQLQDAKNRFSEVINHAIESGPQVITRRGKETAVVLSADDYRKLTVAKGTLAEFFLSSPLAGSDIDLERDKSLPRPDLDL
jgi:prevent-host-death family protein